MAKVIELSGIVGYEITAKGLKNRFPKDGGDVLLKVDSVGGSVFEGNRLYNAILDYPGKINVELGAIAASAASYFPLAAGAENIAVRENTTFMAHKAWTITWGNADDLKAEAEILDGFDKIIARVYSKITGKSVDDTLSDMSDELWLIGGQSVVDAGFASSVVEGEEVDPADEPEVVDKSEILAMIETAKNKLRELSADEDLEKWAAKINNDLSLADVDETGQHLLIHESVPNNSGGNIDQEKFMDWKDFLEKNPEARAEYEKDKNAAVAEGIEKAVAEDRERSAEVLALAGTTVPEAVLNAVKTGMSVGDFAKAELKNRNNALAEADAPDLGGVVPQNQVPEAAEEDKKASAAEKKMDDIIDKMVGKDKEDK